MDYFLQEWEINQSILYNDLSAEKYSQKLQPWHTIPSKSPIQIPQIKPKAPSNQEINNANRLRKRRLQRLKQNQLLELFLQKNIPFNQANKSQPIDKNIKKTQSKEIQKDAQKERQCFTSNLYGYFQNELRKKLSMVKEQKSKNKQFHLQKILKQKQKIRKRNYSQVQKIKSSIINAGYVGELQKQYQLKKAKRSFSQHTRFSQIDQQNKNSKIVEFYKTQLIKTQGQIKSNNVSLNNFGSFLSKTFYI